jgi:hypothetical protein
LARESHLSRYERDFEPAGNAPSNAVPGDQREAIACFLSAGDGWAEALKALSGAFASAATAAPNEGDAPSDKHQINHPASEYLQWPGLKSSETDND